MSKFYNGLVSQPVVEFGKPGNVIVAYLFHCAKSSLLSHKFEERE